MYAEIVMTVAMSVFAALSPGDRGSVSSQGREAEVFFDDVPAAPALADTTVAREQDGRGPSFSLSDLESEDFWAGARAAGHASPWNPMRGTVLSQGLEMSVFFDGPPSAPTRDTPAEPADAAGERLACHCQ